MQHLDHIECRTFDKPDEQMDFKDHGRIDVLNLTDGSTAVLATLEPGWTWEVDEKPLLGDPESCPLLHVGYCTRGELIVRVVATGQERRIKRGDFFEIPPGHDARVVGDETCQLIMFAPSEAQPS